MSRTLQFKRYANTAVANITGANGELIIDGTNHTITVHDGVTVGGTRIATEPFVNTLTNTITTFAYSTFALTQSAYNQANAAYYFSGVADTIALAAFNTANNASNGLIQNAESNNYVLQISDAGKYIYYTHSSNVTLYIPTTSNVTYTNGTTIMVVSQNTVPSVNITVTPNVGVSLYSAGNTISGSHNVTPYGVATLMMVKANTWFISGFSIN